VRQVLSGKPFCPSAQWEHTIGITETGIEVFTAREEETEWFNA
jgi:methionine aminopeptidase